MREKPLDTPICHGEFATHMLGPVEVMREHFKSARSHCEEAIQLDDSLPEDWSIVGTSNLAPGEDSTIAQGHLERAFRSHPSSVAILQRTIAARADAARGQSVDGAIAQIRRRRDGEARRVGLSAPD